MMIPRLFTAAHESPSPRFKTARRTISGFEAPLDVPADWSLEATEAFSVALMNDVPSKVKGVEENTLPSWLWRRQATEAPQTRERSARAVFDRVVGGATYRGWKLGLWHTEKEAATFHDEALFLFMNRALALEPEAMRAMGISWAYGLGKAPAFVPPATSAAKSCETLILTNGAVDAFFATENATAKRASWLAADKMHGPCLMRFPDATAEWNPLSPCTPAPRLMIDLSRFCGTEGKVDVPALQHAVRIGLLVLEMHYADLAPRVGAARPVTIGLCNLAPLLMLLGLAYDSPVARATAASLAAIVTAEATGTSADLAALFGACPAFAEAREDALRALRNMRRAAYGERNDYERLSIVPTSLTLEDTMDLVLPAAARHGFDTALEKVQQHGLRHLQTTGLFTTPSLARFLECAADGIDPQQALVFEQQDEEGHFARTLPFFVWQGFQAAGLDPADSKAVANYLVGYGSLKGAPGISCDALRSRGFDDAALARLAEALPEARKLRAVFTPWVLGVAFCEKKLGLTSAQIEDPGFDLLAHLGFSEADIARADAFCCGHKTAKGATELTPAQTALFATRAEIKPLARIQMASAVQSFLARDIGLCLSLPAGTRAAVREAIILDAWRHGLQSLMLDFGESFAPAPHARKKERKILQSKNRAAPQIPAFSPPEAPAVLAAPRKNAPKAPTRALPLEKAAASFEPEKSKKGY